jgi:hypothetical protein
MIYSVVGGILLAMSRKEAVAETGSYSLNIRYHCRLHAWSLPFPPWYDTELKWSPSHIADTSCNDHGLKSHLFDNLAQRQCYSYFCAKYMLELAGRRCPAQGTISHAFTCSCRVNSSSHLTSTHPENILRFSIPTLRTRGRSTPTACVRSTGKIRSK